MTQRGPLGQSVIEDFLILCTDYKTIYSFWGNSEKLKAGFTQRVVKEGSAVQYA